MCRAWMALWAVIVVTASGSPLHAQNSAPPGSDPHPVRFEFREHPRLVVGRALHLDFEGKFEIDSASLDRDAASDSRLDIGRRRVGVSGSAFRILEFQIERELVDDDPWRDVYVAAHLKKRLTVKAGKFKAPYSHEQLTGSLRLDFIYRPLAVTALSPGRQVGVLAEGDAPKRLFTYELGWFREGEEAMSALRLTSTPFRQRIRSLNSLEIGVSATVGDRPEGQDSVAGRTYAGRERFFPAIYVNGPRRRGGYEVAWSTGPFRFAAEYLHLADSRRAQGLRGEDLPPLKSDGWFASFIWLAGERRATRLPLGVTPLTGGGFEVGVRLEEIRFRSDSSGEPAFRNPRAAHVLGNADRALTFGVNWHASRFARVQCNAIRERIADAPRSPNGSSHPFWSVVTRLQLHL